MINNEDNRGNRRVGKIKGGVILKWVGLNGIKNKKIIMVM